MQRERDHSQTKKEKGIGRGHATANALPVCAVAGPGLSAAYFFLPVFLAFSSSSVALDMESRMAVSAWMFLRR
jgi:hypothetical protein